MTRQELLEMSEQELKDFILVERTKDEHYILYNELVKDITLMEIGQLHKKFNAEHYEGHKELLNELLLKVKLFKNVKIKPFRSQFIFTSTKMESLLKDLTPEEYNESDCDMSNLLKIDFGYLYEDIIYWFIKNENRMVNYACRELIKMNEVLNYFIKAANGLSIEEFFDIMENESYKLKNIDYVENRSCLKVFGSFVDFNFGGSRSHINEDLELEVEIKAKYSREKLELWLEGICLEERAIVKLLEDIDEEVNLCSSKGREIAIKLLKENNLYDYFEKHYDYIIKDKERYICYDYILEHIDDYERENAGEITYPYEGSLISKKVDIKSTIRDKKLEKLLEN
jgi:hypothetical protein